MVYFAILSRLADDENRKRPGATRPLQLAGNGRMRIAGSRRIFCDEIGTEGCVENTSYQARPAELLILAYPVFSRSVIEDKKIITYVYKQNSERHFNITGESSK